MTILPPETTLVDTTRVRCDGSGAIRGGEAFRPAALGHPRVWLEIDGRGYADCPYCDRRFELKG
jgi:NADH dehydrogenase (ubiquinone) Fe-S protein 6